MSTTLPPSESSPMPPDPWACFLNSPFAKIEKQLLQKLGNHAEESGESADWNPRPYRLFQEYNVFRWFVPEPFGGLGWTGPEILAGYVELAAQDLTAAFVLTQRSAAVSRLVQSANTKLPGQLLPELATGKIHATIGISHLTTSHQHRRQPALVYQKNSTGILLDGFSPWVTAAEHADWFVMAAVAADQHEQQVLFAVPREHPGVCVGVPNALLALSASRTGPVRFEHCQIPTEWILAGPHSQVMSAGGGKTGGLQTSALAIGHAKRALRYLAEQAQQRPELSAQIGPFVAQGVRLYEQLLCPNVNTESLRLEANQLVLAVTQAALIAAKGAGYLAGHPVGKWCREALFFLVWSCPPDVSSAYLCELAASVSPSGESC